MKILSPVEIEKLRRNVPSELRTADWDRMPLWVRERAFFMAGVADAEILQEFREMSASILRGDLSQVEARARLRVFLKERNYVPLPGQEDTIKDLRSVRRMRVALETNVRMMQGKAQWDRYRSSKVYPVMKLVRIEPRINERDWEERWNTASFKYGDEVSQEPMAAPHGHPIWRDISRFGQPFPPYDFGSGMGQMPVRRDHAEKMLDLDAPFERQPEDSLNADLELKPRVSEPALRQALSERLGGYAEWQGNKLIFTDPNGTRPATAEALVKVWEKGVPEGFPLHQQDRLVDWVQDSKKYDARTEGDGLRRLKPDTNGWEDFQRLVQRLENAAPAVELWRGMAMKKPDLDSFLRGIKKSGYEVRWFQAADSWTGSRVAAVRYAGRDANKWKVILRILNPSRMKDITPLVRHLEKKIAKIKTPPVSQDAEWLLPKPAKLELVRVKKDIKAQTIEIELKEVGE